MFLWSLASDIFSPMCVLVHVREATYLITVTTQLDCKQAGCKRNAEYRQRYQSKSAHRQYAPLRLRPMAIGIITMPIFFE